MKCPECGALIDIEKGWQCLQCSHVVRPTGKILKKALIGQRVARRYDIKECLGVGSCGIVFKGWDLSVESFCRVKFFFVDGEIPEEDLEKWFSRWSEDILEVKHRNILAVKETGQFAGLFFEVCQYVEGQTLDVLLARIGLIPFEKLKHFVEPMARGLAYAHKKGLCHFDLNPANVLIGVDGVVRITDFGPARSGAKWAAKPQSSAYLAPEQTKDGGIIDQRADVYAFGGIIMTLMGLKPDTRDAMEQMNPDLKPIIARMRDPELDVRYQSISACIVDFELLEQKVRRPEFRTGHWAVSKAFWIKIVLVVLGSALFFMFGRVVLERGMDIDVSSASALKGALNFGSKETIKVSKNFSEELTVDLNNLFTRHNRTGPSWKKELSAKLDFLIAKYGISVSAGNSGQIGESKLFGMGRSVLRALQKKLEKTDENFRWLSDQYDHSDPQMERVALLRKELALEKTDLVDSFINVFGFAKILDTFPVDELPVWLQNYNNIGVLVSEHKWDCSMQSLRKASEFVVTAREQTELRENFYSYYIRAAWYWFNKGEYLRAKDLFDGAEKYAGNKREVAAVKKGYSSLFDHFATEGLGFALKGEWDSAFATYKQAQDFVFDGSQQERLRTHFFDLYSRMIDERLSIKEYDGALGLLLEIKPYASLDSELRKVKSRYFNLYLNLGMEQAYSDDFISARESIETASTYAVSSSDKREAEKALLFLKKQEKLGFSILALLMKARQASADYDLVRCVSIAKKVLAKDPENVEAKALIADPHPKELVTPAGITFVYLLPGKFEMGSAVGEKDEAPRHRVRFVRPFYMGKFEVSQKIWEDIMGDNPSRFVGDDLPVDSVSWDQCKEFVKKLNTRALKLKKSYKYNLPTEAEWEFACRAGMGEHIDEKLEQVAWYDANSGLAPHKVGQKDPNEWGLFDMLGNVREWCLDYYKSDYYAVSPDKNPQGPVKGKKRVVRGGSWGNNSEYVRCSARFKAEPDQHFEYQGLRLMLEIKD